LTRSSLALVLSWASRASLGAGIVLLALASWSLDFRHYARWAVASLFAAFAFRLCKLYAARTPLHRRNGALIHLDSHPSEYRLQVASGIAIAVFLVYMLLTGHLF
jgi:hypothetical protein